MRISIAFFVALAALAASPAAADDRAIITQHVQDMSDALVPGNVAPWQKYLDPDVIYAEEDDSFKGKAAMIKEVSPMPKGLNGQITVELLDYHEDGDTAVATFRQHETEEYYGQTIHASYLLNTTWKKRADGWKMIEAGTLAERTDPPAVALPADQLAQYAGTYKLRNSDPIYTLTIADGTLIGARTGRTPSEWNNETPDVFFIKGDPRIRKIFQRDASGKITGFLERRESWSIYWDKVG